MEDSDGGAFTVVENRKKRKCKTNSAPRDSDPQCLTQTNDNSAPARDKVTRLAFPKGVSPRDRAIWLAEVAHRYRNLSVEPKMTAKSIIAVTRDVDTVKFLTEVGHPYQGNVMKLTEITEMNKQTKVIIRNYPSYMPMQYVEDYPSVLWARRNTGNRTNEPRNQVIALWEGEPPETICFPGVMPCKVERFVGRPAFCGRCQRWGHREWQCDHRVRCGFCAESHDTKVCKERIIREERVTPKCANCQQEHNAWSVKCPMRPATHLPRNQAPAQPPTGPAPTTNLTPAAFPPLQRGPHTGTPLPQPPARHPTPRQAAWAPPPQILGQSQIPGQSHLPAPPSPTTPQTGPPATPNPPLTSGSATQCQPTQTVPTPPGHQQPPPPNPLGANKLEKEVKELRSEVQQLRASQDALKRENRELRDMITTLQSMPGEMASIKAMLSQLLRNTIGAGQPPREEHCVAPISMDTDETQQTHAETQTASRHTPKEPQHHVNLERKEQDASIAYNPGTTLMTPATHHINTEPSQQHTDSDRRKQGQARDRKEQARNSEDLMSRHLTLTAGGT